MLPITLLRFVSGCAVLVGLIGLAVLASWTFHGPQIANWVPEFLPMNPLTALLLGLAAVGLWFRSGKFSDVRWMAVKKCLGGLILLISGWVLLGCVFRQIPAIDGLFWRDRLGFQPISFNVALAFFLVGMDLFQGNGKFLSCLSAYAVLTIGLTSLIGHIYSVPALISWTGRSMVAPHAGLGLTLVGMALVASRPDRGLMMMFMSDSAGGFLARRILPFAIIVPLVIGWLSLQGSRMGFYHLETGVALSVICNILILLLVMSNSVWILHRADEDQKKIRRDLAHAEKKYRSIFENAVEGIFQTSPDGQFLNCNPALASLFGYASPKDLLLLELDISRQIYVDASRREDFKRQVKERGTLADFESQIRQRDGHIIWISETARAQRDGEGRVLFYEGTIVDITRRKLAEEGLTRSERRFETFMNNNPAVVFMKDQEGRYIYANHTLERVFGISKENLIGKTDFDWLPHSVAEEVWRNDQSVLNTGKLMETIERVPTENGQDRWWFSFKFPIDEANGSRVVGGVSLDITERQEAEIAMARARDMAVQSTKLKSEFLANMSHEIRTPMNGIIGMTGLLLDTTLSPKQLEFARTIKFSSDALLDIINDILDFSKIEAGMLRFENVHFDLHSAVEDAVALLAERAADKGLELVSYIDPDVPTAVIGDPGRLRQVLTNLIGNAIKFTAEGEVVVKVDCLEVNGGKADLRFSVQDTGIGLNEEQIGRLFKPFSQADGSTTRKYGGTGLGLAISKQLVQCMGGDIAVNSAQGKGSDFWFTASLGLQDDPYMGRRAAMGELKDVRVLVVDDNSTNRTILHHQVTAWGMVSVECPGAVEALQILEKAATSGNPFQIAILDMQMPDIDGFMLAASIKANPVIAGTKLIMLTSLDRSETEEELAAMGLQAHLPKPVRLSRLFNVLSKVVGSDCMFVETTVARPRSNAITLPGTLRPVRMLLAEDNPVNRQVALHQLDKLGYHAEVCVNGREALDYIQKNSDAIDIVLMDCQMPEMDGYEATRAIRAIQSRPIWIIAMTAHSLAGDRDKCLASGMDDYISKPVTIEALKAVLERAPVHRPRAVVDAVRPRTATPSPIQKAPAPAPKTIEQPVIDRSRFTSELEDEDFLRVVVDLFITHTPELIENARLAFQASDPEALSRAAHTIKGSCSNFGAMRLQEISQKLEETSRDQVSPDCAPLLDTLENEYLLLKEELLHQLDPEVALS